MPFSIEVYPKMSNKKVDYYQHARGMKAKLDSVSPTMCLAKWLQVSMHLPTGLTQSCYHPPVHKVPVEELRKNPKALHNTKEKFEQRRLMKEGLRPAGCDYCWKIEDASGDFLSDRAIRSSEWWAKDSFDEVVRERFDYNVNPRYVEVNFNHTCNLKCAYCSPHLSSSWAAEAEEHGPFPTIIPHNDPSYLRSIGMMPITRSEENPYVEAFWEWWPDLYNDLKVFRMTGGEPLLDKNTFKVLDWIIEHPRTDLELAITSNMCPPEKLMDRFIERMSHIMERRMLKSFTLFASVDTWGSQAEYIRTGLNFEVFWKNIERYLDEVPRGMVTFIITMNCLSLPGLKDLLAGILELQRKYNIYDHQRILIDSPFLRDPAWMNLRILPEDHHHYLADAIRFMEENRVPQEILVGFRNHWIGTMKRTEEWMKGKMDQNSLLKARANFHRFFTEYDRRRKTDFKKVFPEFVAFWDLCEKASQEYV